MTAGTNRIITPLILTFVLLTSIQTFAGKIIYVDKDTRHSENHQDYVPDEIIIKFKDPAAGTIGENTFDDPDVTKLNWPGSLGELNKKFRLSRVERLFKNFKANKERTKALLKKDKALLTKREKHILQRLKRAPEKATVPALDRIYKLQFDLAPGQFIQDVLAAYNNDPAIEYAELNYIVTIDSIPNDPYFSFQWSLHNTGQMYPESGKYNHPPGTADADIDAPEAWDIQTGSDDIIVAVADTGVDYNHRDIDDNMWTDSNGYHGYDFYNNDNYPMDDHGHGTHCAGIIAAEGNNGLDIAGVCWNVKIMALKFLDETGSGTYADAAEAFYYAANNGADVISNSWSKSEYSQTMQNAIDYAYSKGVIIVASAGNQNNSAPRYPANNDHVIAVAATNSLDEKAPFSNYGDWIDIAAPGVDTLSLRASGSDEGTPYDSYTTIMSGTSMSCPHVAGACALILSNNPALTVDEVNKILCVETDTIPTGICRSNGRLNLYKLLTPSKGRICLDKDYYSCTDEINIKLIDFDLQGEDSYSVLAYTDACDIETVLLSKKHDSFIFTNKVFTEKGEPIVDDGILQVLDGQTIYVTYEDANDGFGVPEMVIDTAVVDCCGPVIHNVQTRNITSISATVTFQTNENSTSSLIYGLSCDGTNVLDDQKLRTEHSFEILGLEPKTIYYFKIEAQDELGNVTVDNNDGLCYQFTTASEPNHIYVPTDYPTIQEAINAAIAGYTIVVSDGTYTGISNRNIKFNGKMITLKSASGPENCIIDCEAYSRGFYFSNRENQYSVVDGFTIKNGYTTGRGGGIYCSNSSPTIINCIIKNNTSGDKYVYWSGGGGVYCHNSNAKFINCVVSDNYTRNHGGGIWCYYGGTVKLLNCVFIGNKADYVSSMGTWSYGGAISCYRANVEVSNCLIANNWAHDFSGGIDFNRSTSTISSSTIVDNQADEGWGGISQYLSNVTVSNSIIWGNTAPGSVQIHGTFTVSYSDIQGGWSGLGNINANPSFVTGPDGDYYLSQIAAGQAVDSPCVDAGSDSAANLGMDICTTRTDQIGDAGTVDMGYHYSTNYGSPDIDGNWHVDCFDYSILSADWRNCSEESYLPGDITRDTCVNGKDLKVLAEFWLDCFIMNASNPQPANEARGVDPNRTLSWAHGVGALYHDVYFGTDANAVASADHLSPEFMGTVSEALFDPCSLELETIYYWRIDEVGPTCMTQGELWKFTTRIGLISWWKFDEGQGTIVYDSAGENDGTTYGPTWTTGQINAALSFDGVDDYVDMADTVKKYLETSYTVSAWIKTNTIVSNNVIAAYRHNIYANPVLFQLDHFNEDIRLTVRDDAHNAAQAVYLNVLTTNTWYHVAGIRNGNDVNVYVDGNSGIPGLETLGAINPDNLKIGALQFAGNPPSNYFDGIIDDVRIYDRALSANEIQELYQTGLLGGP